MKIFQRIQRILATMGFTANQQQSNHGKSNFRQMAFVAVCAVNAILLVFYISLEANTIDEYMDAIFSLTVVVGIMMAFISLIFKNDDIFTNIEFCEKTLTESKCGCLSFNAIFNHE